MKILLVDNSVLMLNRLQEMLSNYPEVEIVACLKNGNFCPEAIRQYKPDLAIIDLRIPGLKGLEVLKAVRKENRNIGIIIFSFFATANFRLVCMLAGADYFFSKVYDFEKVEQVVQSLLQEEVFTHKLRMKEMTAIRAGFHQQTIQIDK